MQLKGKGKLGQSRAGVSLDPSRKAPVRLSSGLLAHGRWIHRLFSPVSVRDPEGLIQGVMGGMVLSKEVIKNMANARNHGFITDSFAKKLIVRHKEDKRTLRYMEKLLYGGGLRWQEEYENIVVNEGLDHLLDVTLSSGTQETAWYIGLLDADPTPAAGWTATDVSVANNGFGDYDEGTLPIFTDGGVVNQSVDNSASPADFSINADSSSVGGAFLITTNAKVTPAGILYAAGPFQGGNKPADNGDTLSVTATFTSADDGV